MPSLITSPFGYRTTAREAAAGHDLAGRRIIVTGAASGIGVETARALAALGVAPACEARPHTREGLVKVLLAAAAAK